jgi:hypothetical protein
MATVARFLGIVIYIYFEPEAHRLPHFHAAYGGQWASFQIEPPNLLAGSLPRRQLRYVLAWAEMHQEELLENWHLVQAGRQPRQIPGL